MDNWIPLAIPTPADREAVALALYRAGYTVRQKKRKEGNKTVISIEFCREASDASAGGRS